MTKVEITEWGETDLVKWHQSRRKRKYWFQATKCKINYWYQFSEAISKLAIVAGIITIITKGINK